MKTISFNSSQTLHLEREKQATFIHLAHEDAEVKKGLIMLYESHISMWYTFNIYTAVSQFYLNKKWGMGRFNRLLNLTQLVSDSPAI